MTNTKRQSTETPFWTRLLGNHRRLLKRTLYLDDVAVFDNLSQELLVLRLVLLLLQFGRMLRERQEHHCSGQCQHVLKTQSGWGFINQGTCNFLNRSPCVLLFPCFPCFAFQNCFWAEYLFMGHTLKRQSRRWRKAFRHTEAHPPVNPKPLSQAPIVVKPAFLWLLSDCLTTCDLGHLRK